MEMVVYAFFISKSSSYQNFSILIFSFQPPLCIFTDVSAFFLRLATEYGDQKLPNSLHGIEMFFLEINGNISFLQSSNVGQAVHGISGKSTDGFCQYQIDIFFFLQTPVHHQVEIISFFMSAPEIPSSA